MVRATDLRPGGLDCDRWPAGKRPAEPSLSGLQRFPGLTQGVLNRACFEAETL